MTDLLPKFGALYRLRTTLNIPIGVDFGGSFGVVSSGTLFLVLEAKFYGEQITARMLPVLEQNFTPEWINFHYWDVTKFRHGWELVSEHIV